MWFMPRLYLEDQLPLQKSSEMAIRREEVGVRWSPASESVCQSVEKESAGSQSVETCSQKAVVETGHSLGTQRKGNVLNRPLYMWVFENRVPMRNSLSESHHMGLEKTLQ
jgi:hypothetical protein